MVTVRLAPWRLLLFEDLNDQTNDADDHQAILKQIAVSYHGITPSEKRRGDSKLLPPHEGKPSVPGRFDSKPGVSIPYILIVYARNDFPDSTGFVGIHQI